MLDELLAKANELPEGPLFQIKEGYCSRGSQLGKGAEISRL